MTALGAEGVWPRLLSLVLGGTVYTFSLILAAFLIGLGIGSSLGAFLSRRAASARLALGVCQWLLTAAIAWTAAGGMPYWARDGGTVTASASASASDPAGPGGEDPEQHGRDIQWGSLRADPTTSDGSVDDHAG